MRAGIRSIARHASLNEVVHRSVLLPICIVVGVATIAIGCYTPFAIVNAALAEAGLKSEQAAQQIKALRVFYSDSVVVRAIGDGVRASPLYKTDPTAIPVPTTFILDATEAFSTDEEKIHLVSPYPWPMRAGRVLDDFQAKAWATLSRDPTARVSRRETIDGREVLRVAVGDRMDASCVACHNTDPLSPKKDWKVGDVRGIIEVVRPIDRIIAGARRLSLRLVAGTILAGLTLLLALHSIGRRLVRPMHDLVGVIDRIAGGALEDGVPHTERADELGTVARALGNLQDQTSERLRAEAQISHMALHDGITGLPNRVAFTQSVSRSLVERDAGDGLALLYIDLDRFKAVNDTLGHAAGDLLLRAVADRLRACAPHDAMLARLGGDEFAIASAAGSLAIVALAVQIVDAIAAPFQLDGRVIHIGASIGIAVGPSDGATTDDLLKNADLALYRSKNEGRGRHRFFEASMDACVQARRALELDLRGALAADQFELHYQPLVDVKSGVINGFEALLRWRHPTEGLIPPTRFIALAEETGEIEAIGAWVIQAACREARTWPASMRVAVNLSPLQFRSGALALRVVSILAETGLEPDRLELEIVESLMLQNTEATLDVLHQLRALGVRIALDDFGTGYSSLSYLRSFPLDKIKIDRSFVEDMVENRGAAAIVRAVLDLGAALGMVTTAEGVETREQLDHLRREGCAEAQGFFLGKPTPACDLGTLIASWPSQRLLASA